MAGTAIYSARVRQSYASKAQRITLAAAVFDHQGRILVSPDGALPSEEITSKFLQKVCLCCPTVDLSALADRA